MAGLIKSTPPLITANRGCVHGCGARIRQGASLRSPAGQGGSQDAEYINVNLNSCNGLRRTRTGSYCSLFFFFIFFKSKHAHNSEADTN